MPLFKGLCYAKKFLTDALYCAIFVPIQTWKWRLRSVEPYGIYFWYFKKQFTKIMKFRKTIFYATRKK